jgi:inhibitor of cysteine peptidase
MNIRVFVDMRISASILFSIFTLTACTSISNSDRINQADTEMLLKLAPNKELDKQFKVGETFLIELESNPSTGYRWVIANRKEIQKCLLLKKEQTFPATQVAQNGTPNLAGAPGKQQWQFLAKCSANIQIRFEYRRSWESASVPAAAKSSANLQLR